MTVQPASCTLTVRRVVCGRPAVGRWLTGWLCTDHAPPAPVPDPQRTLAGLRAGPPRERPTAAYGNATSDPLGRDKPDWELSKQTRLPARVKGAP